MEQKFVEFEEAIKKLGISAERLNGLREAGQLRAYRDGSSWKFRTDEIEAMVTDGVPDVPPPSDIGLSDISLVDPSDLVDAGPLEVSDDSELEDSELELELAGPEIDDPEINDPEIDGSEIELAELDDTVTAGTSDVVLDSSLDPPGPADSILLSEEELGDSQRPQGSTIIGKSELESGDADLELVGDDDPDGDDADVTGADVIGPSSAGASDVLSSGVAGSGVLDELKESSGGLSAFEDLEELEIDLAAESSRILSPEDIEKVKEGALQEKASASDTDLRLDDDAAYLVAEDVAGEANSNGSDADIGSTDVPLGELESSEEGSGSEIELAGDDDILLADAGGSDITLDTGDSGINLLPSDSGLALDDISLEAGGSAILSSLSLEGSDPEISLLGGDSSDLAAPDAEIQTDDDFQLTPMSEGVPEADGDSSSQVIALDSGLDDLMGEEGGVLDDDAFAEDAGDGVVLADDFAEQPADGLGVGYAPTTAPAGTESRYTWGNNALLGSCALLLMFSGVMMVDMVRNIWSWNEPYSLNSSLMDAILGWMGK